MFERGAIEIAPLAFMRGRTLNHAFIILDEAQNTTPEQMKMFLTRIGFGSKAVVTGDVTQIDLAARPEERTGRRAGSARRACAASLSRTSPASDVVRHPLVQRIVNAYEQHRDSAHDARRHSDAAEARCMRTRRSDAQPLPPQRPARDRSSTRLRCRRVRCFGAGSAALRARCTMTVRIVGAREGRALNRNYRGTRLRDERADVRLRRATSAVRRRHRAVRAGRRARSARAGQDARARTTRTWSCTACCTCRATITRRDADATAMEALETRIARGSATPIPMTVGSAHDAR